MKGKHLPVRLGIVCIVLSGCTSVEVKRADPATGMRHVCIEENPRVTVPDFLTVLRDGIDRNGLSSEVYREQRPAHCEFVLTYTALRSWDLGTYLSHAELRIERDGRQLASAQYHLRGKGGFSLTKWQGVETKMNPVIDELFADYRKGAFGPLPRPEASASTPRNATSPEPLRNDSRPGAETPGSVASMVPPLAQGGFAYTTDPTVAAKAMAQARNCGSEFRLLGSEVGRNLYSASCWGNKKLVIICEQGTCREAR